MCAITVPTPPAYAGTCLRLGSTSAAADPRELERRAATLYPAFEKPVFAETLIL